MLTKWKLEICWFFSRMHAKIVLHRFKAEIRRNFDRMSKTNRDLKKEWVVMTLEQRKAEVYRILLHHCLKMDSDEKIATERAHWSLQMNLDQNPELELDVLLWSLVLPRRMELERRAKLKRRKWHKNT